MISKLFAIFLVFIVITPTSTHAFSDITYNWYKESIQALHEKQIINGYDDGIFAAEKPISRAEILKILLGANNNELSLPSDIPCFKDVDTNMWYHSYICSAYETSIAKGFDDGNFRPNSSVTVLEALAFGVRTFSIDIPPAKSGELWYEPLRIFAAQNSIVDISRYTIETPISRGLAADIIVRLQAYKKNPIPLSFASPGCTAEKTSNLSSINTIRIGEKERSYLLFIPSGYTKNTQYKLIIASHGRTNSNTQVRAYMGLEKGNMDTIIAYPEGIKAPKGGYSWSEAENLVLIDAILQEVSNSYCIDRSKVFAIGHSLGGWFSHKLSCLRGNVFRGMSAVGSSGYSGACNGPMASIIYQRSDDKLSPYAGGVAARERKRELNLCSDTYESTTIGGISCKKWSCSEGNPVVWCEDYATYGDDAHSWPTINAKGIFEFFARLK